MRPELMNELDDFVADAGVSREALIRGVCRRFLDGCAAELAKLPDSQRAAWRLDLIAKLCAEDHLR